MKALAAEMTATFGRRLRTLGVQVREFTGDMQLSRRELDETHMIVTTPEKWDVVTRKSSDGALATLVRLLIIDEVHLLNEDRGSVIESLVARTLRLVESAQVMIRIVGLSATLPNYRDVAEFLCVRESGLHYFGAAYRPVPLQQQFVGMRARNTVQRLKDTNQTCFDRVCKSLREGNQAMIFVHSRKETVSTAEMLLEMAEEAGELELFTGGSAQAGKRSSSSGTKQVRDSRLRDLLPMGVGFHNAGMLRPDRSLVERLFTEGQCRVICCTATLAWGVNLPAHTVIIKGTRLYNAAQGCFVELGMLDVLQIFGRAGRPQFDTFGEATIITEHAQLPRYLNLLTKQLPIESRFITRLPDHLNAEVVLGTVSNLAEACRWLQYTYLVVRMRKNPLVYGLTYEQLMLDPDLQNALVKILRTAAQTLQECRMVRFDPHTGTLGVTEAGRIASHFYIQHETMRLFLEELRLDEDQLEELEDGSMPVTDISEARLLYLVAQASEFEQVKLRDEEVSELRRLSQNACPIEIKGGLETAHGKVNVLLQAHISRAKVKEFSLISDLNYIADNSGRILRALFEFALSRGKSSLARLLLRYGQMVEHRLWYHRHPLAQFVGMHADLLYRLENCNASLERLCEMDASDIGHLLRHPRSGDMIKRYVSHFPHLELEAQVQPITRTVLRIRLTIYPSFRWEKRYHGAGSMRWWVWVEDHHGRRLYHSEQLLLTELMCKPKRDEEYAQHQLTFTVPLVEPLPPFYFISVLNDRWLGAESSLEVPIRDLDLPSSDEEHTALLDLQPLQVSQVIPDPKQASIFKYRHFNPIQTQAFHTLFHTDENVLLGAPTGSGKTVAAELAILRLLREHPDQSTLYIGPLKALVDERGKDWRKKFGDRLGCRVCEFTGEHSPDPGVLNRAQLILTTPEKWDGVSRGWRQRPYVRRVGLVVLDEVHLLGADRGPVLEVVVARMRHIAEHLQQRVRVVALSTALANATDLADWLVVRRPLGLYNFLPSLRPVQLRVHIAGFPGKHYCPRMASMNKPTYAAICQHSPEKPVLVFVSSRRQTRLTALDLIAFAAHDDQPRRFLRQQSPRTGQLLSEHELEAMLERVRDASLRHTLAFGIGLHHAGLCRGDKELVEMLFAREHVQVLVSTSTLAWGVNLPAHLVVIKGTEFFDPAQHQYVDYPITDVLQMMGRAGRPQFDTSGSAVVLVHQPKKSFYKNFIYQPFPVESSLHQQLADHLNAEVAGGQVRTHQDALDYLTWTFLYRRLLRNPSYYGLESTDPKSVARHLSQLIDTALVELERAGCLHLPPGTGGGGGGGRGALVGGQQRRSRAAAQGRALIRSRSAGRIAAYYYLRHRTMLVFGERLRDAVRKASACTSMDALLLTLCHAAEFEELPVRHNEDQLNEQLAAHVRLPPPAHLLDCPHHKASLLLQAHFARLPLPISDYVTDTKSVLDQAARVLQALVDVLAHRGLLFAVLRTAALSQQITQGRYHDQSPLLQLGPHATPRLLQCLAAAGLDLLPALLAAPSAALERHAAAAGLSQRAANQLTQAAARIPRVRMHTQVLSAQLDGDVRVRVRIERLNHRTSDPHNVYTTAQSKRLRETWWLIVGVPGSSPPADYQSDDDDAEAVTDGDSDEETLFFGDKVSKGRQTTAQQRAAVHEADDRGDEEEEEDDNDETIYPDCGELLVLKRVNFAKHTSVELVFDCPCEEMDREDRSCWIYLMCGSYMGIDQQAPLVIKCSTNEMPTADVASSTEEEE